MAGSGGLRQGEKAITPAQVGVRVLVVIGALLVGSGLLQRADREADRRRASFAVTSGTIRLTGLAEPIEILRDDRGIPHLRAARENEGWFGLGFVHAQDRLGQMLWLRRKALGRTAEIAGAEALSSDRLARVLEIAPASVKAADALPDASRSVLEAYAEGVNARIARLRPAELKPLNGFPGPREEIEPWLPRDSLAVVKLFSWCMGGTLETTLVLDELIQQLDSVPARPFFPSGASVDFGVAPTLARAAQPSERRAPLDRFDEPESTRRLCEDIGTPSGSAWVLDGRRSESASPILVADWHLAPTSPALFYEAQVEAGPVQVAGATMPGTPIFWAGRNRFIAWASVPASAPISDLFIETLRNKRSRYQNGRRWVAIEEREEQIGYRDARGEQASVSLPLRRTRHGPLIEALYGPLSEEPPAIPEAEAAKLAPGSDVTLASTPRGAGSEGAPRGRDVSNRSGRALAWTGARPGDGFSSMLSLLRATSAAGVNAALEDHHEPVLAVAHADRQGAGGVQVAGWMAKRPLPTGIVPVQGRLRAFEWRERVPLAELPNETLGAKGQNGLVIAADQPWSMRAGLTQTEWLWRPGQRARRIETALAAASADGPVSLREASAILMDDVSERAPRVVAGLLILARTGEILPREAEEIAHLLARWDGSMAASSAGAAAYHLVIEQMIEGLLKPAFGPRLYDHYLSAPHVRPQLAVENLILRAAQLRRTGGWTDEATVARVARESLRDAWIRLNHRLGPTRGRWSWGGLHALQFSSLGGRRFTDESALRARPVSGGGQTILAAAHRPGEGFGVQQASVYRIAMDLASTDHLLSALVPGQSEHPGHPHFADGMLQVGERRLPLFATNRLLIDDDRTEKLVLEPAP